MPSISRNFTMFAFVGACLVAGSAAHKRAYGADNAALFAAAEAGNAEEVSRLLAAGADLTDTDKRGEVPLHYAAASGSRVVTQLLIDRGADVNAQDRAGFTPLHVAAYLTKREIAELLLQKGAKINARSRAGWTPLHKAMERIAHASVAPNQSPNASPSEIAGVMGVVELLLANGADVNVGNESGTTPLHYAAAIGENRLVELLVAKGGDMNAKGEDSVTPLYLAAKADRREVAELLISRGADVNARTKSGYTPLSIAAENGSKDCAAILVAHHAEINTKDNGGDTPLKRALFSALLASPSGHLARRTLLEPAEQSKWQEAMKQADGRWRDVAALLIEHGADPNLGAERGPPLYIAATIGDEKLVRPLVDHGADLNGTVGGETALHSAIAERHGEVAALLINKGANVKALNRSARTPLHFLAEYSDDPKLAELMIKSGADVNAKDKRGFSPLSYAISAGHNQVAEVLRQGGATGTKTDALFTAPAPAPSGYATLVIYRGRAGFGPSYDVDYWVNGERVARLGRDTYTYVYIREGQVMVDYTLVGPSSIRIGINAIAGETYFLYWATHGLSLHFAVEDRFAAKQALPRFRYVEPILRVLGPGGVRQLN